MLLWALGLVLAVACVMLAPRIVRRVTNRMAARSVLRFRARVDRFKLTSKAYITQSLLGDEQVASAVRAHASEHVLTEAEVWVYVERYIDEIVPFFNIVAYYNVGYAASRVLLNLFYKVTIDWVRPDAFRRLPRESIVVYLMNHRSNADYLLVAYALAGEVSISYAVGEWARAFPLEYLFKSFGSYFIRRRYREALYHTVLERYVQLITRNGVTQGIFPEGGLTRDGRLMPSKIGLLDYMLGIAREPGFAERMYLVPVGINYDRVLEDRSLLQELASRGGARRPPKVRQLLGVLRFAGWNAGRLVTRRWKRYGRAAVCVGEPVPVGEWLARQRAAGSDPFTLPRGERLARVQTLADEMMSRVGQLVPITSVPLACAALQSLDGDFVTRARLVERMGEMRDVLRSLGARIIRDELDPEQTFERAYRMLRLRRVLVRSGSGFAVLPRGRPLIGYYANSIAHLLGPYEAGVRERDAGMARMIGG